MLHATHPLPPSEGADRSTSQRQRYRRTPFSSISPHLPSSCECKVDPLHNTTTCAWYSNRDATLCIHAGPPKNTGQAVDACYVEGDSTFCLARQIFLTDGAGFLKGTEEFPNKAHALSLEYHSILCCSTLFFRYLSTYQYSTAHRCTLSFFGGSGVWPSGTPVVRGSNIAREHTLVIRTKHAG